MFPSGWNAKRRKERPKCFSVMVVYKIRFLPPRERTSIALPNMTSSITFPRVLLDPPQCLFAGVLRAY